MVGGQGVVGAGTDGAPRVVALGDGLLAISTVAHIGGTQVVSADVVYHAIAPHGDPVMTPVGGEY